MVACLGCGKVFAHDSGLSRHKRGNSKTGGKPCELFLEYEKKQREEAIKQAITLMKTPNMENVYDFNPFEKIPDFVTLDRPVLPRRGAAIEERIRGLDHDQIENIFLGLIATLFEQIHMNIEHREYWNVILVNVSAPYVRIKKDGSWHDIFIWEWAQDFTRGRVARYIEQTEAEEDQLAVKTVFCSVFYDEKYQKEICRQLKMVLRNDLMRKTIKNQYGMK